MGASATVRRIHDLGQRVVGPLVVLAGLFLYLRAGTNDISHWGPTESALAARHESWTLYLQGSTLLVLAGCWAWLGSRPWWIGAMTLAPGALVGTTTYFSGWLDYDTPLHFTGLLLAFPLGLAAIGGNLAVPPRGHRRRLTTPSSNSLKPQKP